MATKNESVLTENVIRAAAQRVERTPAQVALRWAIQRGTAIIPKTTRKERLIENISLYDFQLNSEEMAQISALNINRRFNDPAVFCEQAFNRFYSIYD